MSSLQAVMGATYQVWLSIALWWNRVLSQAAHRWDTVQDLCWTLKPARFSMLTVVLGFATLVFSGQGREVLLVTAEGHWSESVTLFVAVLLWASFSWFWARTALQNDARPQPVHPPSLVPHTNRLVALETAVPRILGTAAFATVATAYAVVLALSWKTETRNNLMILLTVFTVGTVMFYWAVRQRRSLLPTRAPGMGPVEGLLAVDPTPTLNYGGLRTLPRNAQFFLALTVVGSALVFVVATLWPVHLARAVGPGFILIVGLASWIPFGTVLVSMSWKRDLPLLTVVALLVVGFSVMNNNHKVRLLDQKPVERGSIEQKFQNEWRQGLYAPGDGKRIPIVIVATAGGASRAAYLTATVLGKLQDENPNFARQVFAISGVSGGSLGAAAFHALVAAFPDGKKPICNGPNGKETGFAICGQRFLEQDFLGPTLAGLMYPDLVQRFLPWPLLPDRAAAIERAWEDAWIRVMGSNIPFNFEKAFTSFHPEPEAPRTPVSWSPLLFLNGTSVATGSRIVAAQAQFEGYQLPDSLDLLALLPKDVRLSTAVDMSTRFPYVEPAGVLPDKDGKPWDRIVDGGYFENFGATTAIDILWTLRTQVPDFDNKFRPIVVQISNDSGYRGVSSEMQRWNRIKKPDDQEKPTEQAKRDDQTEQDAPGAFLYETTDPLSAFAQTRGARGRYMVNAVERTLSRTMLTLKGENHEMLGDFVEIRIFDQAKEQSGEVAPKDPPLGWRLSEAARKAIAEQVMGETATNAASLKALRTALSR